MIQQKNKKNTASSVGKSTIGKKQGEHMSSNKKKSSISAKSKNTKGENKNQKKKIKNNIITENNSVVKKEKIVLPKIFTHFRHRGIGIILCSCLLLFYKGYVLTVQGVVDMTAINHLLLWYMGWLGNDLLYIFLVWIIAICAMRIPNIIFKSLLLLITIGLLAIYTADLFALVNLHSRFILTGLSFFSLENARPFIWQACVAIIIWFVLLQLCVFFSRYMARVFTRKNKKARFFTRIVIVFLVLLVGVSFFIPDSSSYQQNIIQLQLKSNSWGSTDGDKTYEEYFNSFKGKGERPNIILVFLESFSNIDSQLAGGNKNMLPGFDSIAKDGTFYTNFIANGCTSDSAHIASLQGVEPWETKQLEQNYMRYKSYTLGLPGFLHQQGYSTTFLSTASLGFLGQKDFLTSIQFDSIVGPEAFAGKPTYVFDAAPDEYLYEKAEEYVKENNTRNSPYFLALQTISSHKPYETPDGKTEEEAFRYADNELGKFYDYLESVGYFDNGILLLVGDHRKMQALSYDEINKWGDSSQGKTLFAIVGKNIPKGQVVSTPTQHRDIFSSLKRLTGSGNVLLHQYYNDIFGGYVGRDAAIRYCQYVDKQYVASRTDGTTRTIVPDQRNMYAEYIRSYYDFQRGVSHDTAVSSGAIYSGLQKYPGLMLIAHQGYAKNDPVNSLNAFNAAKGQGATGIEIDISFTKDGYPIVMHGPDIGRTKCVGDSSLGKKNIDEFTLQEMKDNCQLYNGQVILTLQEVLEKTQRAYSWYFVDIKTETGQVQYVQAMLDSIKKLGLEDNVMFSSTEREVVDILQNTKRITAGGEVFGVADMEPLLSSDIEFLLMHYKFWTPEAVQQLLKKNIAPIAYTVNDPKIMSQLYDWGIRYFLTDDPQGVLK